MSKRRPDMADAENPVAEVGESEKDLSEPELEPMSVPRPAPSSKPLAREVSMIRLEVFLRLTGKKADQLVPFARWAKRQRFLPRSMSEWKTLFEQFMNRPIIG